MPSDASQLTELSDQLEELYTKDPRRHTLLEQYLEDLRYVLEQSNRNYASAKQLYILWDDPPFQPQTLGQLLSTIADLGALRIHVDGSNHNQYDLTEYDRTRMQQLACFLETNVERNQSNQNSH